MATSNTEELAPSEIVYMERLKYLKEISDQQRVLSRTEAQVERAYEAHQKCEDLIQRCRREAEVLKDERERLTQRLQEIDTGLDELSNLSTALQRESSLLCSSAPLSEYNKLLTEINSQRQAGQLPPLDESLAFSQLNRTRETCQYLGSQPSSAQIPLAQVKAGKSHKLCPGCCKQVSRNATHCPHCSCMCSKTSHPTQASKGQVKNRTKNYHF